MSQQINLLRDGLEILELPWSARRAAVATVLAAALVLAWTLFAHLHERGLRAHQAALQSEIETGQVQLLELGSALAARRPDPHLPGAIDAARGELAGKRWIIGELRGGDAAVTPTSARLSQYLRGLGEQRVDGLWLDRILIAGGGRELALGGQTRDARLLPEYLLRLGQESAFAGREFQLFRIEQPEDAAADGLLFNVATRCGDVALQAVCTAFASPGGRP